MCVNLWKCFLSLSNKKRKIFNGKNKICVGSFTQMTHILLNRSSVQQIQGKDFLFAFIQNIALMCIPVYNLESYEYFQMGICKVHVTVSLFHMSQFHIVSLSVSLHSLQLRLYFSLLNSTRRFTVIESLLQNFDISFFTLTDE